MEIILKGKTYTLASTDNLKTKLTELKDQYNKESFSGRGAYNDSKAHAMTKKDYLFHIKMFKDSINAILKSDNLVGIIENATTWTKANNPHKGRRNTLESANITMNYSDEHGSHAYTDFVFEAEFFGTSVSLIIREKRCQSTF